MNMYKWNCVINGTSNVTVYTYANDITQARNIIIDIPNIDYESVLLISMILVDNDGTDM